MSLGLSRKEKGFVRDVAAGMVPTQAALKNYDTESYHTAGVIAHENLKKPKIQNALEEALPDELLAKVHREGLFATKPIFDKDGKLVDEDADYAVRHKYLDSAYKLKGKYAPDRHLNVNVEIEATPELEEAANILNEHFKGNGITGDGAEASSVGPEA